MRACGGVDVNPGLLAAGGSTEPAAHHRCSGRVTNITATDTFASNGAIHMLGREVLPPVN
jgi:hypothetical protein